MVGMTIRGKVIYTPPAEKDHHCGPGAVWHEAKEPKPQMPWLPSGWYWHEPDASIPLGMVVECDCGQTWVCAWQEGQTGRRFISFGHKIWRKETNRECRRRRRTIVPVPLTDIAGDPGPIRLH